ncbi:electron transfer flavoprotein subunit beta/FixA family protein [Candidatus Bathyarchaeota archaeon]|nr:MAG: electron transfer flavoprotein subunit beta/FixA family protein [Candidatus Bathyarchaeota archaeon]
MNIIVCIKQVPETTEVEFDEETGTLKREGIAAVVNPFDEYAVEEGLRLREKYSGNVKVLSMGPPQAEAALRDTIALGCDEAWLATDRAFAGADTWATSYTLGLCIEKLAPYDLIICGLKTTDGDTGQVGPELAQQMGIPHVCYVNKILGVSGGKIKLTRFLDDGVETLEASLPLVISVSKDINQPRLATLRGRLQARKAEIHRITSKDFDVEPSDLGLDGSPTRVVKIFTPTPPAAGEVFEGSPDELAGKIFEKLLECKVI